MDFPQYVLLNCFQVTDEISFGELQKTQLPLPVLQSALQQLADHSILRIPPTLDSTSVIQLNVDMVFNHSVMNLVPETSLQLHNTSVSTAGDMMIASDARIDAAIVRIMKKKKFMKAEELAAEISTFLSFVPDVRVIIWC